MKHLFSIILIIIFLACSSISFTQILLPKGFKYIKSNDHYRSDYFTNGKIIFYYDVYGREVSNEQELKEYFESMQGFEFKKTKDGLYWGSGYSKGSERYFVLIPNLLEGVMVSSPRDDIEFSNYSKWLLKQVRLALKLGKSISFYCK